MTSGDFVDCGCQPTFAVDYAKACGFCYQEFCGGGIVRPSLPERHMEDGRLILVCDVCGHEYALRKVS